MSEPNVISSSLSRNFLIDGHAFKFEIYKLENIQGWCLEVIDDQGTSTVWDEQFATDEEAQACLLETLEKEGLAAFKSGSVIAFPKP